jgi:uncharacterized iron-regulated membrane protein
VWLFGIAALIWTVDCFVAFYLTFPIRRSSSNDRHTVHPELVEGQVSTRSTRTELLQHKSPSFWSRWAIAWKIKWRASAFRINFDCHRAGGLWTWGMLFVFAWSGVAFNLNQQIYLPVMKQLFEISNFADLPIADLPQPRPDPSIDFKTGYQLSRQLIAEQAHQKGFKVQEEIAFSYNPAKGLYSYNVKSDFDMMDGSGMTLVWIDGNSGAFVDHFLPTGQKAGDTITLWLQTLHMAKIWGLPYKLFVCLMGLVVAMLSITGVYIWWKKRHAKQRMALTRGIVQ